MINRITVTNQKGGVGKTTIAINLARFLAKKGFRILFFDLDVSENASMTLDKFSNSCELTSYDFFTKEIDEKSLNTLTFNENIQLIKANPKLVNGLNIAESVRLFETNVKKLESKFDLIIIDTPPTLNNIFAICLFVSKKILIPIEADMFSLAGLQALITSINNAQDFNSQLSILGLVVNRFDSRKRRKDKILNDLRDQFKDKLLQSIITERDSISEATALHIDIRDIDKKAAIPAIYELNNLTEEVLSKLQDSK